MAYFKPSLSACSIAVMLALLGCDKEIDPNIIKENNESQLVITSESQQDNIDAWKTEFQACATPVSEAITALQNSAEEFLDKPLFANLEKTQKVWLKLESQYQSCFDYLIVLNAFKSQQPLLSRLSYWPMIDGYIDTTEMFGETGIVNDLTLDIKPEVLIEQHQRFGDEQISLGLYVIGFLLGINSERTAEDYQFVPSDDAKTMTLQLSEIRRREYLKTAIMQWQSDWQKVVSFVGNSAGNSDLLLKESIKRSLKLFLQGKSLELNSFKGFSLFEYHQQLLNWMNPLGKANESGVKPFFLRGFWSKFSDDELLRQFSKTVTEENPFGDEALRVQLYQALFYLKD